MKHILFLPKILVALLLGFGIIALPAEADTVVNKDISSNTTWTATSSPYILTKTITVEADKTLTIEPGVTVQMPNGYDDMFILKGIITAVGTAAQPITFDGGGNSAIFNANSSRSTAFTQLENTVLQNGTALWKGGFGYFSLKNSLINNFTQNSYIEFPGNNVYIEYNEFKNFSGFSLKTGSAGQVYFRYNRFDTKNTSLPDYTNYIIQSVNSFGDPAVIAYNSFINIDGVALQLATSEPTAALNAANNYWGTTDTTAIAGMIVDKNDSAATAGYITYDPILSVPHSDTPGAVADAPTPPATEEPPATDEPTTPKPEPTEPISIKDEQPAAATTTTGSFVTAEEIARFIAAEKNLTDVIDNALAARVSGRVLLQVQNHGEAWYVNPTNHKKYYMANGEEAYRIMRYLGVGISNQDLQRIQADQNFAKKHSGKIFLQVEQRGEAYYIDVNGKAHYLKDGSAAYVIMRNLGLGITNADVRKITVGETGV